MSLIPSNFRDGSFTVTDDAGNSATLQLGKGDISVDGLKPGGAELVKIESRGAVVGARKGARAYPSFSMTAVLAAPAESFKLLVLGLTAGFVSVTADIGDYPGLDFDFDLSYGAESRHITGEDLVCTGISISEGEESTVSFQFEVLGPLSLDGDVLIASR